MATLLGLPRELRDEIIRAVLYSPPVVPRNVERTITRRDFGGPFFNRIHRFDAEQMYRPTALGLLLANHQIAEETSQILSREAPAFAVDIAIVNECWLWPAWRLIPTKTKTNSYIERLDVHLRLCCTPEHRIYQSGFAQRHPLNLHIFDPVLQTLFTFLDSFTVEGAAGDLTFSPKNGIRQQVEWLEHEIRVKRLNFNIITVRPPNEELPYEQVSGRVVKGLKHLINDPLYAADPTTSCAFEDWLYLSTCSLAGRYSTLPTPDILHHTGFVDFYLDGKLAHNLDLARYR
ncbi:hypothetical protein K504DRAFT_507161 [Pleomassaria siparia CBS 279.74]|uniref:Uncharacterized protein n=1 Tax=Pleomassaria siparia CBS 279.74 TaxID=1314801 RepID=A0A6G1JU49_9PLEO|nr:hypothetical protein K504DRAFT_507161 [Pleomassaria siparia CBS 279.74]